MEEAGSAADEIHEHVALILVLRAAEKVVNPGGYPLRLAQNRTHVIQLMGMHFEKEAAG